MDPLPELFLSYIAGVINGGALAVLALVGLLGVHDLIATLRRKA